MHLFVYEKTSDDVTILLKAAMELAEPVKKALTRFGNPMDYKDPFATACASMIYAGITHQVPKGKNGGDTLFEKYWRGNKVQCDCYLGEWDLEIMYQDSTYRMSIHHQTDQKVPSLVWAEENQWSWRREE